MYPCPSRRSLIIALLPFVALCFAVPWWDRLQPRILGMPFNLFWLIAWIVLTSACLGLIYRLEHRSRPGTDAAPSSGER